MMRSVSVRVALVECDDTQPQRAAIAIPYMELVLYHLASL